MAMPYVGVTGPASTLEAEMVCEEFFRAGYSMATPHVPMVGILVSDTTLSGTRVENRRYPPIEELDGMLRALQGRALAMVHYTSCKTETLADQVETLLAGPYEEGLCRAIQLNVPWPDPGQVALMKERFAELQVVLQASGRAIRGLSPFCVAQGIRSYGGSISHVLIDPSEGRGMPFDIEDSLELYAAIREHLPSVMLGFAGGYTGENVAERTKRLIERTVTTAFCIDAEGGLRDEVTPAFGDDLLNILKVRHYLQQSWSVLP